MNELTINQVQEIIGWSYPTAFDFARANGRKVGRKWLVPFDAVAAVVQSEVVKAQRMQGRLVANSNGST